MLKTTKSQTINGGSWLTENGVEIQVASMYGAMDNAGNRNYNSHILNTDLYQKHKDEVDTEIKEFEEMVQKLSIQEEI